MSAARSAADPPPFEGFGEELVDFYEGLAADNSKAYWTEHEATYRRAVRAPLEALAAALAPDFGDPKIFRPYRDVRFSKDKSPYKTAAGALLGQLFYVQLDADGMMTGAGTYRMEPEALARYRRAVDDDLVGARLEHLVDTLTADGAELGGEQLTRMPRGFPAEHAQSDLMRRTSLWVARRRPPSPVLHSNACLDLVRRDWESFRPFADWLTRYVTPDAADA